MDETALKALTQSIDEIIHDISSTGFSDCNDCGRALSEETPVVCEAFRYNNFPDRPLITEPFLCWSLVRTRCRRCETTTIESGTLGVEEALVRLPLRNEAGQWFVEDTHFEILDYSSAYDGFEPPHLASRVPVY